MQININFIDSNNLSFNVSTTKHTAHAQPLRQIIYSPKDYHAGSVAASSWHPVSERLNNASLLTRKEENTTPIYMYLQLYM